jgi:acetate kinase
VTRAEVLAGLEEIGVELEDASSAAPADAGCDGNQVRRMSRRSSRVAVYVVPAEEDRMIAVHVMEMSGGSGQ